MFGIIVLTIIGVAFVAYNKIKQYNEEKIANQITDTVLNVDGMRCSACETRIQDGFEMVDGVLNVDADYINKTVTITTKGKVDENVLKNTINDMGYEVVE